MAAANPIDAYLASVAPERRAALERIRTLAHELVPGAEETISYRMPTLTLHGKPFLGFAARAHHIGIYPFSGRVLPEMRDDLRAYEYSRGALRVPYDLPLSKALLKKIIARSLAR